MQNDAAVDLNGDGKYDENDEYGMVSSNLYVVQMLVGFGNKVVIRDNDESGHEQVAEDHRAGY